MTENGGESGDRTKIILAVIGVIGGALLLLRVVVPAVLDYQGETTKLRATQTAEAIQAVQTAEALQETQTAEAKSEPPTKPSSDSPTSSPCGETSNCDEPEDRKFRNYWTGEVKGKLGCPDLPAIEPANTSGGYFVEQEFHDGFMVWVRDPDVSGEAGELHFALIDGNKTWFQRKVRDIFGAEDFNERGPSPICNSEQTQKSQQGFGPRSGFSILWCDKNLSSDIGEARGNQGQTDKGRLLKFKCGYMLRRSNGDDYILYRDSVSDEGNTEVGTYVQM